MRFRLGFRAMPAYRTIALVLGGVMATVLLVLSSVSLAQQGGDSRPRKTDSATGQTGTPEPTPTPAPQTSPGHQIAPQLGQPPPPPVLKPKPTPTPDPAGAEINPDEVLKFNTDLVTLNVRVIDRNNRPINNLRQEEFKIYEDGVPQSIFSFSREEVPIIYGLAVDTSGSVRPEFNQIIDAAKTIINSNKRGDETFLERFISSDKIETIQDFTSNQELLFDGLESLYIEGGQTAVLDGVYLAAEHVAAYKKGTDDDRRRRALIVVTDGEDRNSYYKDSQLFERLREEDVQIFVIGFVNELDNERGLIRKSPREKAVNLINRLASETGGRAFFPNSIADLPEIANTIVRDMRTQYVISYDPTNRAHDGTYRAIKVSVTEGPTHEKRIALTRSGRTAGLVAPNARPATKRAASPANGNVRRPATNVTRKSP